MIYGMNSRPPENFIAQLAFTALNSFILTTDGRVFSWGALHYCLGRQLQSTDLALQLPGGHQKG